jgi:hypothetical protein
LKFLFELAFGGHASVGKTRDAIVGLRAAGYRNHGKE